MFEYVRDFEWNSSLALLLYWLPLAVCLYGYTVRTWVNYRKDVRTRPAEERFYCPTDTLGDVLGRMLSTVLPFANLVAAVFDVAPGIFRSFFSFLHKAFSQPLVPRRERGK